MVTFAFKHRARTPLTRLMANSKYFSPRPTQVYKGFNFKDAYYETDIAQSIM